MDPPLLGSSVHHTLKRRLRVQIGTVKEELKLVVKIDKNLVQLPGKGAESELEHGTAPRSAIEDKTGRGRIFHEATCPDPAWEPEPYICKTVDSTFLCDLVNYANRPPVRHRRDADIIQTARRGRKLARARRPLATLRIRKSQSLILRREVYNPDWNPLKGWKVHFRDIYVNDLLDTSECKEPLPRLCSEMEHAILDGGLREYSPLVKEEAVDFDLRAKMVVASTIQNNNRLGAGNRLFSAQIPPAEERESRSAMAERALMKVEKSANDERTLKTTVLEDSLDQTVPQFPAMEREVDQLGAASPDRDNDETENGTIPSKVQEHSQASDACGAYSPESGLEGFEYNSHAEGLKVNGLCSPPGVQTTQSDLVERAPSETSAGVTIGEQVDEEIKALLDDVDLENHSVVVTEDNGSGKGGTGGEAKSSTPSPVIVTAEQTENANPENESSPHDIHGLQVELGNEETCENEQMDREDAPDIEEGRNIPSREHENNGSRTQVRMAEPAGGVTEAEHVPSDENVLPMDTAEQNTKEVHPEREEARSKMTSVESVVGDDSIGADQCSGLVDSDHTKQELPDDESVLGTEDSMEAGVTPADDEPSTKDTRWASLPEESLSRSGVSQIDPAEAMVADEIAPEGIVEPTENSEEQSKNKGLKLLQPQSLQEAGVSSETAEVMPGMKDEKISSSEGPSSMMTERSQSVIVSNPRSLSQEESKGFHEEKCLVNTIVKSEILEEGAKSEMVDDEGKDSATVPAKMPRDEPTTVLEHPELFQALTPPPAQMRGRGSRSRKVNGQQPSRTHKGKPLDMPQQGIQITSVQTLAPLTECGGDQASLQCLVDGRRAALAHQRGLAALERSGDDDVFVHQKLMRHNSVVLQRSPRGNVQPMDTMDMMMKLAGPPPLVDLSKKGPHHRFIPRTGVPGEGAMSPSTRRQLSPNVHDMSMKYHPERPGEPLGHCREGDHPKNALVDYDPEEQQHHFLEIKRHLLNANPSAVPAEFDPKLYDIPRSVHAVPINLGDGGHPHHPHLDAVQNMPEIPSPLGNFSGAMMEHVKHWKAQNERSNQAQRPSSTEKVPSQPPPPPPQPQLYQGGVPQGPPHAVPVMPVNLAPDHAPNHPQDLPKPAKNGPEMPPGEVNTALLENLQAIHKMYFKTMQGGDKVLFPKMPSNKNAVHMPPMPVHEAVPMVRRGMPPPSGPPSHILPRFPPEGHIPPELLNYHHMGAIPGNIPPPPQLSPSGPKSPHTPMEPPPGFGPVRHRLRFHNMSGSFPRPLLPPQLPPQQFQRHMNRNGEVVMVPVPPGVHRFPPGLLQTQGHSGIVRREMPRAEAPVTTTQTLQNLLIPAKPRFPVDDQHLHSQKEPVEIRHAIEAASAYAKRKAAEGAPLDLSSRAAKVRRLSGDAGLADGDQPIDLSVKAKSRGEEGKPWKPSEVPTTEGRHIVLPEYRPNGQPPHHHLINIATSEHMPPHGGIPPHYSLHLNHHQFIAQQQQAMKGFHSLQSAPPIAGIRPTMSNEPGPVSSTSPHHRDRIPRLEPQQQQQLFRMPTTEEMEIVKMMVRNSGQFVPPPGAMPPSPVTHLPGDVPPHLLTHHPDSARQVVSEAALDNCLKKKRGRPRGSINKRRYGRTTLPVPPPLQIVESSSPTTPPVASVAAAPSPSDTAECQFCDFKAPSRGDVRQHVKAVHFAKFRRDSTKSCEALTPTSDYRMIDLPDQRSAQSASAPDLRQGADRTGAVSQLPSSPGGYSDSEGPPRLVIDTSGGIRREIKQEMPSPTEAGHMVAPTRTPESTHGRYHTSEKRPLKITLRRVSSTGDDTSLPVFSPLPERKPKYTCGTCGASYNYINGLREHESRHRVDLPYECGICHLKYKTMGMLSRHKAQKNHQCP